MKFTYCKPACNQEDLNVFLVEKLLQAEKILGTEFNINSGRRSLEYERLKNRDGTSAHVDGCAVDIYCNNSAVRMRYVKTLLSVGINRIGIYKSFIHADVGDYAGCKPETPVIWIGN